MKTLITALFVSIFGFINVQAQEAFISSEMLAFNETKENYNAPDAEMPLAAIFDGGTGTESDPYQISTAVQLQEIENNLSSHFVLTDNIDASATSGWNGGEGFAPIGSSANPFNGSLDGKGYKITDLTINRPTEDNVGLFASIGTNGSVENLGLDQASVTGGNSVGGLVGMNLGNVSYSHSTGSVSGSSYVGGLIGDHSLNTVSNSYSTSSVTGTYTTGGLVGFSYDNIDNSYATGAVNGDDRVGGFIGEQNSGIIANSYSTGSVSGTSSVGGFVGYKQSFGAASNTFWDMDTSGTTTAAGAGNTSGMTGKSTAQMTTETTFTGAGWDFTSVWKIDGAVNGGYPSLLPEPAPPVFNSSATASIPENTLTATTVLDVNADDGDGGANDAGITYSITGGVDMTAFNIDATTGAITFVAVPDFENPADVDANNAYQLTVQADDGGTISNTATQDITITVTDVNEVPIFTSSATASAPENTLITTTVLDVDADNGDGGESDAGITYTIIGGTDSGAFNIDGATGAITFAAVPDFENPADVDANNEYQLTVQAHDGSASNNTATQDITITVTDENEAPSLTLGATSGSLDENNTPPNELTTITINDDALGTNTLSLSGADAGSFSINETSKKLEFTAAADFETKSSYAVTVEVYDVALGTGPQDSQDFTLTINDILEVPVFISSATASAPENTSITTSVLDVDANDGDGGAIDAGITYSITGGDDMGAFNIDAADGAITFVTTPDFENPTDANADNDYQLTVQVDDGSASNNTATQDITITVTVVNDAPTLTLGATSGSLDENNTPPNELTTITINDDALGTNTLSLSGADAESFSINNTSKKLEFTATADFETKSSYTVTVEVYDAALGTSPQDSQDFTLTINDVNEAPVVINPIADFEVVESAPDSTFDLTHIFSDVDAADVDLTYSVVTNTNPSLIDTLVDNNTNELTIIFQADQAGTIELTIRATDSGGLTADDTFTITVALKKFYLADNDVTIMCLNAAVNETGEVNGVTYTKRIKEDITTENAANTCTSGITDMSEMFKAAETFNEDISHWDVSSVTNMSNMFYGTPFNQPIGNWDVSAVTDMSFMFANNRAFDKPLADWNVSSVTNMSNMFYMTPFNHPISDWVVLSVKDMTSMFYGNIRFNQEIGSWDVDSVTSMENMFFGAISFNKPINDWDVSSVTNMYSMFAATRRVNIRFTPTSFNQPLFKWDVSNVTNMGFMFASSRFNQDLSSWNMESVTNTNAMFVNAYYFNNGFAPQQKSKSIDGVEVASSLDWQVSNITNMASMFQGAEAFNQDISSWNVSNVQHFDVAPDDVSTSQPDSIAGFLVGSGMSSDNASKMFVEWSKRDLQDGASINIGAIELNEAGATAMKTMREANNMLVTWGGQQGVDDKPVFTEFPAPFEILFEESRVLSLWDYVSDTATPDNELQFRFSIISDSAQTLGFDATSGALSVTAPAYADTFRVAMQVRNNEGIASLDTLEVHSVSEITTSVDEEAVIPNEFVLKQNYPNPFNPTTTINYGVPEAAEVQLEVFDMLGRKVATLVNKEFKAAGTYSISFDASSLASGIYIYRMVSGKTVKNQKMTLLK